MTWMQVWHFGWRRFNSAW